MMNKLLFVVLASVVLMIVPSTGLAKSPPCDEKVEVRETWINPIPVEIIGNVLNFPAKGACQIPQAIREEGASSVTLTLLITAQNPQFSSLEIGDLRVYKEQLGSEEGPYPIWRQVDATAKGEIRLGPDDIKNLSQENVRPIEIQVGELPIPGPLLLVWTATVEAKGQQPLVIDPPPVDIKP